MTKRTKEERKEMIRQAKEISDSFTPEEREEMVKNVLSQETPKTAMEVLTK